MPHPTRLLLALLGCALVATAAETPAAVAPAPAAPRERVSFNTGWRFTKGDQPAIGDSLSYERVKDWVLPTGDDLLNFQPVRRTRPGRQGQPEGRPMSLTPAPTSSQRLQLAPGHAAARLGH